MQLTEHFSLEEFEASQTAQAAGIDNSAPPEIVTALTGLAETLEDVRLLIGGAPITITSGYRCPALNTAVGGSTTSAHCEGLAADFVAPEAGTPYEICARIEPFLHTLGVDQLIYEVGVDGEGDEWVHLAIAAEGALARNEMLTIAQSGTHHGLINLV